MLSITLLRTVDLKSFLISLLTRESVASGLLEIKLAIDVWFFIAKEKIDLWVPALNTKTFALFDYKIELRNKVC